MTEARAGQMPALKITPLTPDWKHYSFALSAFETDGSDILGLAIIRFQALGKFQFDLDQVEIK
jgi:hypothetical protein